MRLGLFPGRGPSNSECEVEVAKAAERLIEEELMQRKSEAAHLNSRVKEVPAKYPSSLGAASTRKDDYDGRVDCGAVGHARSLLSEQPAVSPSKDSTWHYQEPTPYDSFWHKVCGIH